MLRNIFACLCLLSILLSCKKPEKGQYSPVVVAPPPAVDTNTYPLPDTSFTRSYLALGDSYTIGASVAVEERFPVQLVKSLGELHIPFDAPEIIAQSGWTTGNLLNRLATAQPSRDSFDIVTLLIGVNNQYQRRTQAEYAEQFELLLQKAIQYAGNRKNRVIVLSIPDYGVTAFGGSGNNPVISLQIDSFNVINRHFAEQYQVNYLNITGYTRLALSDPSLIAPDGLHPSGKEYAVWVTHLLPLVRAVL